MADEQYLKYLGKMQRPIPGSSLTNDPENPLPFEGPPEFVNKKAAVEEIFSNMISPEVYPKVMNTVNNGTPVMDVTQLLLFEGFRQGKWNPDLLLMLIEPTAYMIMGLAERADIDYVVDREPDEEEVEVEQSSELEKRFNSIKQRLANKPAGQEVLPKEIEEKIETLPVDSLLAPETPVEEVPVEEEESLLAKPEGV